MKQSFLNIAFTQASHKSSKLKDKGVSRFRLTIKLNHQTFNRAGNASTPYSVLSIARNATAFCKQSKVTKAHEIDSISIIHPNRALHAIVGDFQYDSDVRFPTSKDINQLPQC